MAANWQPPFGMPFGFPPQTPQQPQQPQQQQQQQQHHQHAQDAQHAAHANPYQTPTPADNVANPWSHIPGLNMQAYGTNSQQSSAYSPAAWPPMPDAWNQAMQNQAMQMPFPFFPQGGFPPPPLPGLAFPPIPFPQTPSQSTGPAANLSPAAHPFQPTQQPALPLTNRITEVADSDKEDGELSEGDALSRRPAVNGSAPRGPPRSVPQSNVGSDGPVWKGHRERYNPEKPSAGQSAAPAPQPEKQPTKAANPFDAIVQQREEAKQFVKLLHGHNFGYRDLAAEGLDPSQLRALYRSLNLPSEPEPVPLPKTPAPSAPQISTPAPATAPSVNGAKPTPSVKTNVAVAPPPAAPSPVDRKEYIARLQAAKKGKLAAGAQATPPQTTPPTASFPAAANATQSNAVEEKARQTQLIKQRLDALKKNSSSPGLPARPPTNGVPSHITSSPAPRVESSPIAKNTPKTQQPVPTTPYSGIPGLFMNTPVAPQTQQTTPNLRKRPLASDFVDIQTPVKQTDAEGMSINLPSRPASAKPVQSAVSTPGAQTPGSQARAEDIDDQKARIAAMKLKIRQNFQAKKKAEAEAAEAGRLKKLADDEAANVVPREAKRLRREKLQTDLAAATNEEAAREAKIREFEKQLAELQAHDQQMKMEKAKLIQELEELGIDTEGMPHEDLRAKKDEIEREQQEASASVANPEPTVPKAKSQNGVVMPTPHDSLPKKPEFTRPASDAPMEHPIPQKPILMTPTQYMGIPGLGASFGSQASSTPPAPPAAPLVQNVQQVPAETNLSRTHQKHVSQVPVVQKPAEQKTAEVVQYATPMDEDEDFYSPKPAEESAPAEQPPTGLGSPSEDGEVAMSVSEDDEYQPDEPVQLPAQVPTAPEHHSASSSDDEEDTYEPPDVDVPISDAQPRESTVETGEVDDGEVDDGAMDISSSDDSDDSDDSDSSDSSDEDSQAEEQQELVASHNGADQTMDITDDLAPELQPEASSTMTNEHDVKPQEADPYAFVPYKSPLQQFKSYRYHPSYMQDVSGGFMSMTYSHQIDPQKTLCPFQAGLDHCSDPVCQFQHFQNMSINGEKLLVQLGTANPGKTPEERQKWNEGLRSVLKELRQKQTKDPNGIAIEIAEYRRRFLNDPTKVVTPLAL